MNVPVTIQGLFHLSFLTVYALVGIKFWIEYKKTASPIAQFMAISFFIVAVEYMFIGFPLFMFPQNFVLIKVFAVIAWVLAFIAIGTVWWALGYLYPNAPIKACIVVLAVVSVILTALNTVPFVPAKLNAVGLMDWTHHPATIMGGSLIFLTTFVPIAGSFIYKTIRERYFLKGLLVGVGLVVWIIFLPLTYQVSDLQTYVFFSSMALLAGLTIIVAIYGNFSYTKKQG